MTEPSHHTRWRHLAAEYGSLLALDSSGGRAAVCLATAERVDETELCAAAQPAESLAGAVAESLTRCNLAVGRLGAIAVGLGPGSYTGLRVGLALAKGLAVGGGVPLYGFSSAAMLAVGARPGLVAVALAARAGELYGALYETDDGGVAREHLAAAAFRPTELAEALARWSDRPLTLIGSGAAACAEHLVRPAGRVVVDLPRQAGFGFEQIAARLAAGTPDEPALLVPLYLRLSEPERQAGGASPPAS